MSLLELILIAVALAMDAFAVSAAAGVQLREVSARQTVRLAFHFGLFQALMPVIGWAGGLAVRSFVEHYAHWVAFGLLAFVGLHMIKEAFEADEETDRCDPTRGLRMVLLAVATSIDALAVGLSLSVVGVSIWMPALVIGLVCFLFTASGMHLGRTLGTRTRLGRYAEVLGGLVLLAIGGRILYGAGVF